MRRATLTAALAAVVTAVAPAPAGADCIGAEVEVRRTGQAPVTVLPAGTCLLPTPWPEWSRVSFDHDFTNMPPGTPSGVSAAAWVVVP